MTQVAKDDEENLTRKLSDADQGLLASSHGGVLCTTDISPLDIFSFKFNGKGKVVDLMVNLAN